MKHLLKRAYIWEEEAIHVPIIGTLTNHSLRRLDREGFWRTDLGINPEERERVM